MDNASRPPTIVDVANMAGVSIATVSRVLNATAPVLPVTAARVQKAIADLNYVPHPAARVLAGHKTNTLGLLLPEISGAYFPPMLRGIETAASQAGYDLLIYTTRFPNSANSPRRMLCEHNTDGLIIFTDSMQDDEIIRLYQSGFPVVLLHRTPPDGLPVPVVTVENKDGAFKIVEHLILVHGKHRIGFLQGPERHEDSAWRELGYCEALQTYGIDFEPGLIAMGGFNEVEATSSVGRWIMDGVEFDAVFTGDDDAAIGVILALQRYGKRIPEDVAVVGFDDVPSARFITPPLTTVRAPIEQVGQMAVHQLLHQIRGEQADALILLPTELIIRNSCGCS